VFEHRAAFVEHQVRELLVSVGLEEISRAEQIDQVPVAEPDLTTDQSLDNEHSDDVSRRVGVVIEPARADGHFEQPAPGRTLGLSSIRNGNRGTQFRIELQDLTYERSVGLGAGAIHVRVSQQRHAAARLTTKAVLVPPLSNFPAGLRSLTVSARPAPPNQDESGQRAEIYLLGRTSHKRALSWDHVCVAARRHEHNDRPETDRGQDREQLAEDRERRANARDWRADQRDQLADTRERDADERERQADLREREADLREGTAQQRERRRLERERGGQERTQEATRRQQAAIDRETEASRRAVRRSD
jgi:hypothetical protein